jgi:hypothetical protein
LSLRFQDEGRNRHPHLFEVGVKDGHVALETARERFAIEVQADFCDELRDLVVELIFLNEDTGERSRPLVEGTIAGEQDAVLSLCRG